MNVEIRTTEPATVAFIRMRGAYSQVPDAIKRLYLWTATHFLQPMGGPSAVYLTAPDEVAEEDAEWEVYTPLARDTKPRDRDKKGRGIRHVEPMLVAATVHEGPFETISETYRALSEWVDANNYRLAGPPEESYLSDPKDTPPEKYLTEVRFPIASV